MADSSVEQQAVPRGGPIYLSDLVGPITKIPEFETSVIQELQSLKNELNTAESCDEYDLLVDDLKVFSEEELVDRALKEAFEVEFETQTSTEVQAENATDSNGNTIEGDTVEKRTSDIDIRAAIRREKNQVEGTNGTMIESDGEDRLDRENQAAQESLQVETQMKTTEPQPQVQESNIPGMSECSNGTIIEGDGAHVQETILDEVTKKTTNGLESNNVESTTKRRKRKRGRTFDRDTRAAQLENTSYIEKIEKLAKIKQKQDDDKLAARLHSFNGGCKAGEGALTLSRADQVKMRTLNFITSSVKTRRPPVVEHVAIPNPEVVLCVEIWNMARTVKSQEFLVLGSQMLTALRDQIYCSTDQLMQKAGKHDRSGYFLIEDMFCNDKRDPSAIDYSEPIFEWLRKSKDEVRKKWEAIVSGEIQRKRKPVFGTTDILHAPQFKAVEMQKVRFCDLWFRLGAGYLYCHQGDCKHFIVIRDMRLIHVEDIWNRAAYPVLTFQHKLRHRKCSVCKIYRATKVTVDDKWAQENPCYFCDNCYYLLHYQQDGTLLYPDFTVYDYHHE